MELVFFEGLRSFRAPFLNSTVKKLNKVESLRAGESRSLGFKGETNLVRVI